MFVLIMFRGLGESRVEIAAVPNDIMLEVDLNHPRRYPREILKTVEFGRKEYRQLR